MATDYIKKKISIEEIIRKLMEIDKIKYIIFENDQLDYFNKMHGPNIFFDLNKNFVKHENKINTSKICTNNDLLEIQEYWLKK